MSDLETILEAVENLGGHYVWESEVKVVSLLDVSTTDAELSFLKQLEGVQQIALDAANLSLSVLREIAALPGLRSLVLFRDTLSSGELAELQDFGPTIERIDVA